MAEELEVRRPCELVHTKSGQGTISKHSKTKDSRHLQSLDLATAFRKITIADTKKTDNRVLQKCKDCRLRQCECPAFMPGMPCFSPL